LTGLREAYFIILSVGINLDKVYKGIK